MSTSSLLMCLRSVMKRGRWILPLIALIALIAGIDDACEAWLGIVDIFHLDTHHGVISLATFHLLKSVEELLDDVETLEKRSDHRPDEAPPRGGRMATPP